MKKLLLWLLLFGVHPLLTIAQRNYDHKAIAILPFRAVFAEYRNMADSNVAAFRTAEWKHGVQLQEELYKVLMKDTARLLVEVQPWEQTNAALKKAGVNFLGLPYMDLETIAKLLKVDACVIGVMKPRKPHNSRYTPDVAMVQAIMNKATSENMIIDFKLIDGQSGNEIWHFSQSMRPNDMTVEGETVIFSPNAFKEFKKRFPYCDQP